MFAMNTSKKASYCNDYNINLLAGAVYVLYRGKCNDRNRISIINTVFICLMIHEIQNNFLY